MELLDPSAAHARARHTVAEGETWTSIANQYGCTAHALAHFNGTTENGPPIVGVPLLIPDFGFFRFGSATKLAAIGAQAAQLAAAPTETQPERNTGGNASYWLAAVTHPKRGGAPYTAECEDIILALGMTFEEGCAFKAIWRRCAAKKLNLMKKNYDGPTYDAEKAQHYAGLMLHADKLAALGNQIVGMVGSSTGLDSNHVPHHKS